MIVKGFAPENGVKVFVITGLRVTWAAVAPRAWFAQAAGVHASIGRAVPANSTLLPDASGRHDCHAHAVRNCRTPLAAGQAACARMAVMSERAVADTGRSRG